MNVYHIWVDLKPGVRDLEFTDAIHAYLGALKKEGLVASHRILRRKLGLGPPELPEFHILVEFETLDQLDRAFGRVVARSGRVEELHHAVNSKAARVSFALYRDFPDEGRARGEELF